MKQMDGLVSLASKGGVAENSANEKGSKKKGKT